VSHTVIIMTNLPHIYVLSEADTLTSEWQWRRLLPACVFSVMYKLLVKK